MKSTIDGETRFGSDQFEMVEHSAGGPIKSKGIATKAGIWIAGGGDVKGKRVWRSPEVIKNAVLTNFKDFYAGNHPLVEERSLVAGQITSARYDPSTQSIVYDLDYYPEKGRPELTEKILQKIPIPNSTKSRSMIDWTPGMVDGKSYDGRELTLELLHLAEVPVGACNPENGCGIGLHCSCSKKIIRGNSMVPRPYVGEITPAVIRSLIETAEKLPEADRAEQALGFLMAIVDQADKQIGMFARKIDEIMVPKVSEQGALAWEIAEHYSNVKPAVEGLVTHYTGKITALQTDLALTAGKLKDFTDKQTAIELEQRTAIMGLIAEHSGFSPETLKTFEKHTTDELVALAVDMKIITSEHAEHHSWEDVKSHVPGTGPTGTTPIRKTSFGGEDPEAKYLGDLKEFYGARGLIVPKTFVDKYPSLKVN